VQHEAGLKRLGVERLFMFDSTARGDQRFRRGALFRLSIRASSVCTNIMDVKEYAAGILGRKTDSMTRDSLHKISRER